MTSDDSFWGTINLAEIFSPSNGFDLDMENTRDLNQLESATSEAQYDVNDQPLLPNRNQINMLIPMPNGSRKSKQEFVSENLSEAKGKTTKKQRRTSYIGESSASKQQPEPKRKDLEENIKEKPVAGVIKNVKDIISRRIKKDKMDDMEALILLMLDQNQIQWPLRPDLEDIKRKIKEIESDYKKAAGLNSNIATMEVTDEMIKRRLVEVREALEKLDEQRRKDSIKTKNLEAMFTNNKEVSVQTLREELSSAFPWLVLGGTATNGLTVDQDEGSLQTRERLQSTFSYWENQLYAMDNNKVDVSDFQGLKEALEKTTWGKTPDYLEPIAIRIEQARGKATEVSRIQVLVCAAIQEMEDLPLKNLNWGTLKKWGATLNQAKELGFQVEFAENLLRKNLYAYFAYKNVG